MSDPALSTLPDVGIDRGVAVFAALSSGELIEPLSAGKKAQRSLARAQRKLARKVKLSNGWRKQKQRIATLQARIARARKDHLHKLSTEIAKNHGTVVIESLRIGNMVRSAKGTAEKPGRNVRAKAGLNRSILDQGWGMFTRFLSWKLPERGGALVEREPAYSSQECSACGLVDPRNRATRDRFLCVGCGHAEHADTNASKVILRRGGTASLPVEAAHERADEAGTGRRAA